MTSNFVICGSSTLRPDAAEPGSLVAGLLGAAPPEGGDRDGDRSPSSSSSSCSSSSSSTSSSYSPPPHRRQGQGQAPPLPPLRIRVEDDNTAAVVAKSDRASPPAIHVKEEDRDWTVPARRAPIPAPGRRRVKTRRELIREFYQGPAPLAASTPRRRSEPATGSTAKTSSSLRRHPEAEETYYSGNASLPPAPVTGFSNSKRSYTADGKFRCDVCYRGLGSIVSLEAHRESFHLPTPCDVCRSQGGGAVLLPGRAAWRRHMGREHPAELAEINEAEAEKRRSRMEGRGVEWDGVSAASASSSADVFVCQHCGKGLSKHASLQAHMRSFHKPRPCQYCDAMIVGMHMRKHIASFHLSVMEAKGQLNCCKQCYKVLDRKQLPRHFRTFHEKMTCADCGKEHEGEKSYKLHRKYVHNDENPATPEGLEPLEIDTSPGRRRRRSRNSSSNDSQHSQSKQRPPKRFKFHCLRCTFSCLKRKELDEHRILTHPDTLTDAYERKKRDRVLAKQQAMAAAQSAEAGHPPVQLLPGNIYHVGGLDQNNNYQYHQQAPLPPPAAATTPEIKVEWIDASSKGVGVVDNGDGDVKGSDVIMELMRMPLDSWPTTVTSEAEDAGGHHYSERHSVREQQQQQQMREVQQIPVHQLHQLQQQQPMQLVQPQQQFEASVAPVNHHEQPAQKRQKLDMPQQHEHDYDAPSALPLPSHKSFDPFLAGHCKDAVRRIMGGEPFNASSTSRQFLEANRDSSVTITLMSDDDGQVTQPQPTQVSSASAAGGDVEVTTLDQSVEDLGGVGVVHPGATATCILLQEDEVAFAAEEVVGEDVVCQQQQDLGVQDVAVCEVLTYTCSNCWRNFLLEPDFLAHQCVKAAAVQEPQQG